MMNVGTRSPDPAGFGAPAAKAAAPSKDLSAGQRDRGSRARGCSFVEQLDESLSVAADDEGSERAADVSIAALGQSLPPIPVEAEQIAEEESPEAALSPDITAVPSAPVATVIDFAVPAPETGAAQMQNAVEDATVADAPRVPPVPTAVPAGAEASDVEPIAIDAPPVPKAPGERARRSAQDVDPNQPAESSGTVPLAGQAPEPSTADPYRPVRAETRTTTPPFANHDRPNITDVDPERKKDSDARAERQFSPAAPSAADAAKMAAITPPEPAAGNPTRASDATPQPAPFSTPVLQPVPAVAHIGAPAASVESLRGPLPAETADSIIQSLRMQYLHGGGDAVVHIRPEHLGPVSVSMRVENGVVSAVVNADNPAVAEWLRANEHVLREGLASNGLHLARFTVRRDGESPDEPRRQWHAAEPPQRRRRSLQPQSTFEVTV